jgi:hypothetical protein
MGDDCSENNVESGIAVSAPALPAKETNAATTLALKTTFAIPLFYADKGIQLAETALGVALPVILKLQHLRSEINKSINTEDEKDSDAISKKTKEDAFITASNTLINNANEEIKTNPDNLDKIIEKLKAELEQIKNTLLKPVSSLPTQGGGGKKIISRTHKSINQFLNPKITASNIKSKRFRSTKSKYKSKSKKRRKH